MSEYLTNTLDIVSTTSVIAISSHDTDIYYLVTTIGIITAELFKIDITGQKTSLITFNDSTVPRYTNASFKDMIVAGNYLFIINNTLESSNKYIYRYNITNINSPPETLSYSTLTLVRFSTNYSDTPTGFTIYANTTTKKIIYFTGDTSNFSSTSIGTTTQISTLAYTSITYRRAVNTSYLYGVYGLATYDSPVLNRTGKIEEIKISDWSIIGYDIPLNTLTPNLILWVKEESSFYISDKFNNGGYTVDGLDAPYNGRICKYNPTFDAITGSIANTSNYGTGILIINGSGTTGRYFITAGMASDSYNSEDLNQSTSQCLNGVNSIGYNYVLDTYVNLYVGNGSSSQTGHLLKLYNSSRPSSASVGGDPHLKTLDGVLYSLPNDHVYFQLFKYDKLIINCSTKFINKDNYPLESISWRKIKRGEPIYITKKVKDVEDNNFIFTYTIMDKIYINYNGNEITINMEDLNITGNICDTFSIDTSQSDHGIFSTSLGVYHKKTKYTKHLSIKCNINDNLYVMLKLGSDISLNDFNDMSIKFHGIDPDGISGCFVSEKNIIKLDHLTQLNN